MKVEWSSFCNSRRMETAVIFGRGPSLDRWIDSGLPKLGDFHIGINSTGSVVRCEYNASRHFMADFEQIPGQWFIPLIHDWEYARDYSSCRIMKMRFQWNWFLPFLPSQWNPTREDMRDYRAFITDGGSCNTAIELAYYLGASNVVFVGIDGGAETSKRLTSNHNINGYDDLLSKTFIAAKRRFDKKFTFWEK